MTSDQRAGAQLQIRPSVHHYSYQDGSAPAHIGVLGALQWAEGNCDQETRYVPQTPTAEAAELVRSEAVLRVKGACASGTEPQPSTDGSGSGALGA